jgi:hypothetical protein
MKGHVREKRAGKAALPVMDSAADQLREERENRLVEMTVAGRKISDIAAALGLTSATIGRWKRKDTFRLKYAKTRQAIVEVASQASKSVDEQIVKSVEARLKEAAEKGLTKMTSLVDSDNEFVAVKASADLMDRDSRMSKTKKVQTSGVLAIATAEQLIAAGQVAREIRSVGHAVEALPITSEMLDVTVPEGESVDLPGME